MNIEIVAFIFGCLLIFIGVLGGGIEVKEIKVPKIANITRILSIAVGLIFISIGIIHPGIFIKKLATKTVEKKENTGLSTNIQNNEKLTRITEEKRKIIQERDEAQSKLKNERDRRVEIEKKNKELQELVESKNQQSTLKQDEGESKNIARKQQSTNDRNNSSSYDNQNLIDKIRGKWRLSWNVTGTIEGFHYAELIMDGYYGKMRVTCYNPITDSLSLVVDQNMKLISIRGNIILAGSNPILVDMPYMAAPYTPDNLLINQVDNLVKIAKVCDLNGVCAWVDSQYIGNAE